MTGTEIAHALDVSPSDSNIKYMGRWDHTDPNNPTTNWGHSIEAWFTGTSISIKMNQNGTDGIYYEYSVDGAPFQTVNASGPMTFALASGLSPGSHHLEFRRRLEASYGMSTFQGLVIDEGAMLEMPDPPSSLQIEFIGDSITAGFGSEGPQSVTTNNINTTWAARLADKLGADRTTIARSGIGISIDVNGTELSMPKRYPDTHFTWGAATPAWNFESWTPDAVMILLGTNDYVFGSPTPTQFETAYIDFIKTVRGKYSSASIFVVNVVQGRTTPDAKWTQASTSLEAVVASLNAGGDNNVHFVDPGEGLVGGDFSDTTHPLPAGHEKMANNLLPLVQSIVGMGTNPPGDDTDPVVGTGGTVGTGGSSPVDPNTGLPVATGGTALGPDGSAEPPSDEGEADQGGPAQAGCSASPAKGSPGGMLAALALLMAGAVARHRRIPTSPRG
jgi:MYXO-CTERM domain-containing protein